MAKRNFSWLMLFLWGCFSALHHSPIQKPAPPDAPRVVTPGNTDSAPPSDATVLFDGSDLSAFAQGENWVIENGIATAQKTKIKSKQSFTDFQLHLEWAAPAKVEGKAQNRGNSGVFLMDRYEIQILDSFENPTYINGMAGAVYKQQAPLVNAMRKPGQWNSYDIFFTAPHVDDEGNITTPGFVTLVHNGVLIQHHTELKGVGTGLHRPTAEQAKSRAAPISIQYHHDPVQFRNIWIRELGDGN